MLLATSLVGSSLFSASGDLWLEGIKILPGVTTLSGPISLSGLPSMTNLCTSVMSPFLASSYPKCWPSRPVCSEVGSQTTCLLTSISPVSKTLEDIKLSSESLYSTTVISHSTKESILPLNV